MGTNQKEPSGLSEDHKAALIAGRSEARVVRDYLTALKNHQPKPGRKRTAASVGARLAAVERELDAGDDIDDPIRQLELLQERIDLAAELAELQTADDLPVLERKFVAVAASFAERKGITYEAWRQLGVPASVLRRCGLRAAS